MKTLSEISQNLIDKENKIKVVKEPIDIEEIVRLAIGRIERAKNREIKELRESIELLIAKENPELTLYDQTEQMKGIQEELKVLNQKKLLDSDLTEINAEEQVKELKEVKKELKDLNKKETPIFNGEVTSKQLSEILVKILGEIAELELQPAEVINNVDIDVDKLHKGLVSIEKLLDGQKQLNKSDITKALREALEDLKGGSANEAITVRLSDGNRFYSAESVVSTGGEGIDVIEYATRVDEVDADTTYVGEALPGTLDSDSDWRIKKITVSGTVTSIEWAGGNSDFDNVWSDRTSLSYS